MTNFTSLYVNGVPTFGVGGMPPFTGNAWFVNAATGSDGNLGSADNPFATLGQALLKATANNNDVVYFTGTQTLTASLVWNKAAVHLVGLCAPTKRGKVAKIIATGTTAGFNNLVSVTASGCWFQNFSTLYGWTDTTAALVCWSDTGVGNTYDTVEFLGFADATVTTGSGNLTGSRAFKLNSTGNTTWRNCVFGTDSVIRNAVNYTVEIAGAASNLTFDGNDFVAQLGSSAGAASHVLVGAAGLGGNCIFNRNHFMNTLGATAMAQAFSVNASPGGVLLLDYDTSYGVTAWQTTPGTSIFMNMPAVSAPGGGIGVVL